MLKFGLKYCGSMTDLLPPFLSLCNTHVQISHIRHEHHPRNESRLVNTMCASTIGHITYTQLLCETENGYKIKLVSNKNW